MNWRISPSAHTLTLSSPDQVFLEKAATSRMEVSLVRFPEVSSQLEFIQGRHALQQQIDVLGLNPMIVHDELGYLQTHPIKGSISAAYLPYGIPAGTKRLSAPVRTANPNAPDEYYILIVIHPQETSKETLVRSVIEEIREVDEKDLAGSRDTCVWTASRVPAMTNENLVLAFDEPLEDTSHVVMAVCNRDDDTSFGWCRWYALQMIIDPSAQTADEG